MGVSLKQSQTARPLVFNLRLSSDHVTPATGKTVTVTLSKNGAAYAACAGAVTEVGNGDYKVAGNATDSNTKGTLRLYATAAGCDPTFETFEVVAYDPEDAVGIGLTGVLCDLRYIQGSTFLPDAAVPIDMTQAITDSQTDGTVGAVLLGMEGEARGKEVIDVTAKTWTKYRMDGTTVIDIFDLDNPSSPTVRTPR